MKFFIDTAKISEIEKARSYGILDGVTTNPSLIKVAVEDLKKNGKKVDMKSYIKKILKICKGIPVSLEVIGHNYNDMVREGKKLYKIFNPVAKNVYIKIPVNPSFSIKDRSQYDGIKAIKELSRNNIPVNCTLIFTPEQALMAAKAGAKFVSPFAGRIDDLIRAKNNLKINKKAYFPEEGLSKGKFKDDNGIVSGVHLVEQCAEIFDYYDLECEVLAASIRNPRQLREVALAGADIATVPFGVMEKIMQHEKTMEGMKNFTRDIVKEYSSLLE